VVWDGWRRGSRFNGKYFTTFTTADGLGNNNIWCILEDKNGNTWFGTDRGGASCYNGKTFTSYTTARDLLTTPSGVWPRIRMEIYGLALRVGG